MTSFLDIYLPDNIRAFPWVSSPIWSTTITAASSGSEKRNQNWENPLHKFKAAEAVRCHETIEELLEHWMIMRGPLYSFPIRDPLDFASVRLLKANLVPALNITDQVIGIGDGLTRVFPLSKTYTRGGETYVRPITLPVVETVILGVNALPIATTPGGGLPGGPYVVDVTREGGDCVFDHAPIAGQILTAGFLFDNPARFLADDSFDRIVSAFEVDGFADLEFTEIRPCWADGSSS